MASASLPDPFGAPPGTPPTLPQHSSEKKTWTELFQAVRRTRKLGSTLFSRVPSNFVIKHIPSPDGNGTWTRLYFLGAQIGSHDNTLLYKDIASLQKTPKQDPQQTTPSWSPLLEILPDRYVKGNFSKEEQLLRERKRIGSYGITSYEYDEKSGRFLFPTTKSLFYCDDPVINEGDLVSSVFPWHIESDTCVGSRTDAKLCPSNPNVISFINNCDIWATHVKTGHTMRLTHTHKGNGTCLADDPKSAGVPSFVVQEEFDRYTGYWWQPNTPHTRGSGVYRVLYEEVDEQDVEIISIAASGGQNGAVDEYRYPRAGTTNAFLDLKMIHFSIDDNTGTINKPVNLRLRDPLKCIFPWMEYILQAGWTPDGQRVYCTLLDRKQQRVALVLLDPAVFCVDDDMDSMDVTGGINGSHAHNIHVLMQDTSDIWLKANDCLTFLSSPDDQHMSFIWASEKSGYRHLYKVTVKLDTETVMDEDDDRDYLEATVIEEVALTQGDWDVSDQKLWVDEQHGLVYFVGYKDTPLETHLYVVSYGCGEQSRPVQRLTQPGYSHTLYLDKECSVVVDVYSSVSQPPASNVFRIVLPHDSRSPLTTQHLCTLQPPTGGSEEYEPPKLFRFHAPGGGPELHGLYLTPHGLQPGKRYPTVLFVYGGPQVQLVTNAYKAQRFLRLHNLASQGYAVVTIDNRGSVNRGLQFEGHIKHRLGRVEINDQVAGLQYLASQLPFIDLDRVAIHGWSYGGYLSLMALVQRPDVFKVAIAGAPVTSWLLYDTGYTERYMDLPANNPDGYHQGDVLQCIHQFPDEENRLLIVHGLIDENVHFLHSQSLINGLVKACKPYRLQIYPNERHGIRNPDASEHYETMVLSFLQANL